MEAKISLRRYICITLGHIFMTKFGQVSGS